MSFPGTYNINYYMGDTLEFRIFPKDSNGNDFPLSTFSSVKFTISERRGQTEGLIEGFARFSDDRKSVFCAITPANSTQLEVGKSPYVYDVEIGRDGQAFGGLYDTVYTLLTGEVRITDQVTPYEEIVAPVFLPQNPTGLIQVNASSTTISVQWTPSTSGGVVEQYRLYLFPVIQGLPLPSLEEIQIILSSPTPFVASGSSNSYTFAELTPATPYLVAVVASNSAGDAPGLPATNLNLLDPASSNFFFTLQEEI
jgi:hypothetical protein